MVPVAVAVNVTTWSTVPGDGPTLRLTAAAPPIAIMTGASVRADPLNAPTSAVPDSVPALSVTTAWPLLVTASLGVERPQRRGEGDQRSVVRGRPAFLDDGRDDLRRAVEGMTALFDTRVMTDSVGASNGTLSQDPIDTMAHRHDSSVVTCRTARVGTRGNMATKNSDPKS